jgi:Skp family chaperone for outer membrane proteins
MALILKYDNLKEIPAEDVRLYVERDGAWHLDADFKDERTKLAEFRTNNVALMKELTEFKQRFDGIDPEEVRRLAQEKTRLEEDQELKAGEFDKVLEARTNALRTEHQKALQALSTERDALTGQLTAIQIDQGVVATATKRGLRATAIPDITSRARSVFRLVNGVPTAFEADGKTVRVGKDGVTAMTLEEWVDQQVSEAPHLFEASAGGAAAGNGSGGAGNRAVRNPFRKETWNLTAQMQLQKTDPQMAARLKAAAGGS